jgi:glycosyltransferase involved in cell wall biosynthesis
MITTTLPYVATPPLVSVVMATHEHDDPRFLRSAIASVCAQTYPNLELVIVADGPLTASTDDYLSRLADRRTTILRLERNGGPARARNAGIEAARGDYIAIMDADDVCAPDRIARQLEFLTATRADLVGSSYAEIDAAGAIVGMKHMPRTWEAIRQSCPFFNPINNPTVLARAPVLKRHRYPEHLRLGEDYRLWIQLLQAGYVVCNHDAPLLHFRRGDEFFRKRRGLGWAISDVRNKLSAVGLARWYVRPAVVAFALLTFGLRLLPPRVNRVVYRARRRIHADRKLAA